MNSDLFGRLETLRQKIVANSAMILGAKLQEAELQAFEQQKDIILPEEYREFLKVVGNGVTNDPDLEYQGFFEILPLGQSFLGNASYGDLNKPFPFRTAIDYVEGDIEEDPDADNGHLDVCHVGDGTLWILIVTGAERGRMWVTYEGYFPSSPRIGFLEWCEQWVERGYQDGLEDLAEEGAYDE